MCGLAGIYSLSGEPCDERRTAVLRRMTRTLIHRGPDDEGYYRADGVGLGHRRLSVIDLETGRQPMGNEDGTVWVAFNGEIYNYGDLNALLTRKGHVLRTRSDTETIVHAYEEWGIACLERFRGMFAFALWDQRQQRLLLARDRLGKKPLYYAVVGDTLIFGSEIKALLAYPGVDRSLDLEALSDYLSLLYIPGEKSVFRQVRKLAPASYLVAERGAVRTARYWDLHFCPTSTAASASEQLAALLSESVALRLQSDVPVGAFLSGGLDSTTVVGLMAAAASVPVKTASIGFREAAFNELPYARLAARHFHTDHDEQVVAPQALDIVEKLVWHYDEPFGDSSAIPTYYVSKLARAKITVALSGDGGDESFAGYRRYYFDVRENRLRDLLPSAVRGSVFHLLGALYPKADFLPQIFRGKAFLSNIARTPWGAYFHSVSAIDESEKMWLLSGDVRRALGGYRTADGFEALYHAADGPDPLSRIQYVDFKTYLPDDILTKVDRASMANSLEIRCPFVDHLLVEYVASLPSALKLRGSRSKLILKEAVRDLLPPEILQRQKMGFTLPLAGWFRTHLRPLVEEHVLETGALHDLFEPAAVERFWRAHERGLRDHSAGLWGLLMFNLWYRRFMGAAPIPVASSMAADAEPACRPRP